MTKRQLAAELIKEKTGPDGRCSLSKKKLGELLHHKYPSDFTSVEHGRYIIRVVTDSAGPFHRKKPGRTKVEWKGLSLPEPEKNDYSKFVIKEKRIGILADIHFPNYHKEALNAAIGYLITWKPEVIVLNGDIIDCYHLSDYEKDPRKRSIKYRA